MIGLVVVATIVVLLLMTGNEVLALKATILNILSLMAIFGALVWAFQDGDLADLFGFTATGGLEVRTICSFGKNRGGYSWRLYPDLREQLYGKPFQWSPAGATRSRR